MKSFSLWLLCCAAMMLGACSSPRGVSASASAKQAACATTGVPAVHFYASTFPAAEATGVNVPNKYASYTIEAAEWKAFAQKIKERGPGEVTGLNIPMPMGCKNFSVTVSSTMSPELAAKYPDLISMKGSADDGADLRMDWDGGQVRGQVILRGDTWLMEPFVASGKPFYLIYHKADASATKKPFE